MVLPDFDSHGDLPVGLHPATLAEVADRFGQANEVRRELMKLGQGIYETASATGHLSRFVIFGSFVTAKVEPRDIDVVMVMEDAFTVSACDENTRILFDHQRAEEDLGASLFWASPGTLLREPIDEFLRAWGTKRDLTRRGIVEVIS